MSKEFRMLMEEDRDLLIQKVDFLLEAFQRLYEKEVPYGEQDERFKNIVWIKSMLSRWGRCGIITPTDEKCIEQNFGLFLEAINLYTNEKSRCSEEATLSLQEIFQKFNLQGIEV